MARFVKNVMKANSLRDCIPLLDDWVDGKPDSWDYETVLKENNVTVELDTVDWYLCWVHGAIQLGKTTEVNARKSAALFVSLWLRAIAAPFANHIMQGYLMWLEVQDENKVVKCPTCHGSGKMAPSSTGMKSSYRLNQWLMKQPCPRCEGKGKGKINEN